MFTYTQSANKAAAGNDALDFREQWHKNVGGERTTMANCDRISWERNSESSSATLTLSIKKERLRRIHPQITPWAKIHIRMNKI